MMRGVRLLLLSDIHANITALEAVLKDAGTRRFDQVVCLGDAVGYGSHANEVLDVLRDLDPVCIQGNHEHMLLGLAGGADSGRQSVVYAALRAQLERLTPAHLEWLRLWRDGVDDPEVGARYRHGTPLSLDDYTGGVSGLAGAAGVRGAHAHPGGVRHAERPGRGVDQVADLRGGRQLPGAADRAGDPEPGQRGAAAGRESAGELRGV
jgi:hypothetical protein